MKTLVEFLKIIEMLKKNDPTLFKLSLCNEDLGDTGMEILAASLKDNTSLKALKLSNNKIGPDGIRFLTEILNRTGLTSLDLDGNPLTDVGLAYLSSALKSNRTLTALGFGNNKLSVTSGQVFNEFLQDTVITNLSLTSDIFHEKKGTVIDFGLNNTLETLMVLGSFLLDEFQNLFNSIKNNASITTLILHFSKSHSLQLIDAKINSSSALYRFDETLDVVRTSILAKYLHENNTLTNFTLCNFLLQRPVARNRASHTNNLPDKLVDTLRSWGLSDRDQVSNVPLEKNESCAHDILVAALEKNKTLRALNLSWDDLKLNDSIIDGLEKNISIEQLSTVSPAPFFSIASAPMNGVSVITRFYNRSIGFNQDLQQYLNNSPSLIIANKSFYKPEHFFKLLRIIKENASLKAVAILDVNFYDDEKFIETIFSIRQVKEFEFKNQGVDQLIKHRKVAINRLNDRISKDKGDYDAWFGLGHIHMQAKHYGSAAESFAEMIALMPPPETNIDRLRRATAHRVTGQYDHALNEINKAIQLEPDFAEAYYNRGYIYTRQPNPDFEAAVNDFTQAIALTPQDPVIDYSNINLINTAIKVNPMLADMFYERSKANRRLGRITEANMDYLIAKKYYPYLQDREAEVSLDAVLDAAIDQGVPFKPLISDPQFNLSNAYALIRLSILAYQENIRIKEACIRWGFTSCEIASNANKDILALIAVDAQNIVVSFRGSQSYNNWWSTNMAISQGNELSPFMDNIHRGFGAALNTIWADILKIIGTSNLSIWFTGHSLGGALAFLAYAYYVNQEGLVNERIGRSHLYTFGQPRCAESALTITFDSELNNAFYYRVINDTDSIPCLPPTSSTLMNLFGSSGFAHPHPKFIRCIKEEDGLLYNDKNYTTNHLINLKVMPANEIEKLHSECQDALIKDMIQVGNKPLGVSFTWSYWTGNFFGYRAHQSETYKKNIKSLLDKECSKQPVSGEINALMKLSLNKK